MKSKKEKKILKVEDNVNLVDTEPAHFDPLIPCPKCKGTGIVQCPGNSNSHTCWDCLEAGRLG